jgi:HEAT repeat protein
MNTKPIMLFATLFGCLLLAGSLCHADDSVATLVGNLQSSDEAVQLRAVDELGALKQKAAEAVTPLAELLKGGSTKVRAHAAHALGEIGAAAKPAVDALAQLLKDPDETVRRHALQAIGAIRPGPQVMVPLCVRLLQDPDPGVRIRVMSAIADAGEQAVPGLIEALDNDKAAYWACLILREMGPVAKDAVPALTKKLQDKDPEIRREAILALAAMEKEATSAIGPIAAAVADEQTAGAATYALGRIGQIPADVEPRIRANAKSNDKMLSTASIWALARVHADDMELRREAAEQLIPRLKDTDALVRQATAHALLALPPAPEITLPIWQKAFQDADELTIRNALGAMSAMGAPAVPRLVEALKYEKGRGYVIYALGEMGAAAAPATPALVAAIGDNDPLVGDEAVLALAKIGPGAKEAVPALIELLQQNQKVYAAAYALGRIGPDAAAAEPKLTDLLENADRRLALMAAWALVHIHPCAEVAGKTVPLLIARLGDEFPLARKGAAEALGDLGPLAKDAVAPLQKVATGDEDQAVRAAAQKAVTAIQGGAGNQ